MTPEERAHLETLLRNHRNRMRELEKQGSFGGTATPPQITIEIEDIKSKILEIDLLLLPKVNMYNRAAGRQSDALECYDIDLTSFFPIKHDDRLDEDAFPSEEIWSEHILVLLTKFIRFFNAQPIKNIVGYISTTHPAAVAFGTLFSPKAGTHIVHIQQIGRDRLAEWWSSNALPDKMFMPFCSTQKGHGSDVVVEIGVLHTPHSVSGPVTKTILNDKNKISVGRRITIEFADKPRGVSGAGHAVAIASLVHDEIRKARMELDNPTVHLFLATPIALAVFIGMRLDMCRPVQCYEYRSTYNDYVPACLLR